jgi:hypothetical protein
MTQPEKPKKAKKPKQMSAASQDRFKRFPLHVQQSILKMREMSDAEIKAEAKQKGEKFR